MERQLKTRGMADWKTYLRWHLVHAKAALSFAALRPGELRFLQQVPARRRRDAAPLEALRALRGSRPGRGPRPGIRRQDLYRRHQAARPRHDQGDREGHGNRPSTSSPGWATRPRSRRCAKLHGMVNKIGYPDKWRDYSSVASSAAISWATSTAPPSSKPSAS